MEQGKGTREGKGNQRTRNSNKTLRKEQAKNGAKFRVLYGRSKKGRKQLYGETALRPPNMVQAAIRKSSPEAIQRGPSTCKKRRRCGRRTAVVREGGVEAAEHG
jgi:hypothetical protein